MNKKLFVAVGLVAIGIGGVSSVALQSHAQSVSPQSSTAVVAAPRQQSTAVDTDNLQQGDQNGVNTVDAISSIKQGDVQEGGDTADVSAGVNTSASGASDAETAD